MIEWPTASGLRDQGVRINRRTGLVQYRVTGASNSRNENQANDQANPGIALPLDLERCCVHDASVRGGKVVKGPSLIQHLALSEVSCIEMSTDIIA
jgi:hypothetical protein